MSAASARLARPSSDPAPGRRRGPGRPPKPIVDHPAPLWDRTFEPDGFAETLTEVGYRWIGVYLDAHRRRLLNGAPDPGVFFVKTVKRTSRDGAARNVRRERTSSPFGPGRDAVQEAELRTAGRSAQQRPVEQAVAVLAAGLGNERAAG